MNFERPKPRSGSAESWSKEKRKITGSERNKNIKRIIIACGNALALALALAQILYTFSEWIKMPSIAAKHTSYQWYIFIFIIITSKQAAFCSSHFPLLYIPFFFFVSFCNVFFLEFSLLYAAIFGLLEHKTVSWPWLFPFFSPFNFLFFLSLFLLSNRLYKKNSWWLPIWSNWHNFKCYSRLLTIQRISPVCQSPKYICLSYVQIVTIHLVQCILYMFVYVWMYPCGLDLL